MKFFFSCDEKYIKEKSKFNCELIGKKKLLKLNKSEFNIFIVIGYSKLNKIRQYFFKYFQKIILILQILFIQTQNYISKQ